MPKIQYEKINIQGYGLGIIEKVNEIIDDYFEPVKNGLNTG
jgi:hypothetical protein